MLSKERCERLLSLAVDSAADFAEIFEEETIHESISMLNDSVEWANQAKVAGVGIRLYQGSQSVYGYSNQKDEESLTKLVKELAESLGQGQGQTIQLSEVSYETRHPIRINPVQASLDVKIDLLKRAIAAAKENELIEKAHASIGNTVQHVQIANSDGRLIQDVRVRTRMAVQAFANRDGNRQVGYEAPGASMGLEFYEQTTPESIGQEASRIACVLLDAIDCPSGKMPVIIDNGFGGVIFHEACGHPLEATAVAKNQSVFANKIGQAIASPKVSAYDDGTIPNAWGSQNIDDEGNFQQRRLLIKDGILQQYMVDTLNGRRMKSPSTGSARRQSYKYEPTSRMSNTYIDAGTDTFEDMLKGVEKGLYAKKMGGGSVNPQTGEFNFAVAEGYLIENGQITKPVKGASLIGTGADILMQIDMVGDNLARAAGMCGSISGSIPTDVGQPRLRVRSITVGGTQA